MKNYTNQLSIAEFDKLSSFIYKQCGIKIPLVKKNMLEARLRKRLRSLGLETFTEYADFLFGTKSDPAEIVHLVDVVSANNNEKFKLPDFTAIPLIYLHPGNHHYSDEPEVISTVLGSCISVLIYSPQHKITVVTHSQMPECDLKTHESSYGPGHYRFTDISIRLALKYFDKRHIPRDTLEVKLFGGAQMLNGILNINQNTSVGKKNIAVALSIVEKEGLRITAKDLGGFQGRKLFVMSDSGDVYLSRLKGGGNAKIL